MFNGYDSYYSAARLAKPLLPHDEAKAKLKTAAAARVCMSAFFHIKI